MGKIFIVLCFVSFTTGCQKQTIEISAPPAIQQIIDSNNSCDCLPWINLYSWRGSRIYVLSYRGPACNWIPSYYDASGNRVEMEQGYTYDLFIAESIYIETIWKCDNN